MLLNPSVYSNADCYYHRFFVNRTSAAPFKIRRFLQIGQSGHLVTQSVRIRPSSPETVHSFIQAIFITLLQVHYYLEALPTQHEYCAGVSRRSAIGNSE